MIDVNDLDGLLELANDYVDDGLHFLTEPVSYGELKLLAERLISAEKDAARYRWLRECRWNESNLCVVAEQKMGVKLDTDCPSLDRLDSAIDEVMKCSGDNK